MRRTAVTLLLLGSVCWPGDSSARTGDLLRRPLYAGVVCGRSEPRCAKVGIAAWTLGRPQALSATVQGRTVRFSPPTADGSRRYWQAFVARERLQAGGSVRVTLTARYADGRKAILVRSVRIRAGWG